MKNLRLDSKVLIGSLISLAVALVVLWLSFGGRIQADLGPIVGASFLIYLVLFTLFLYYNHDLEKDEHDKEKRLDIQNPYKVTLYFGVFLVFVGIIGNVIEYHPILMALLWGGIFAVIYSVVGGTISKSNRILPKI